MVVSFLVNLLCAVVSCAPNLGLPGNPEIASQRLGSRALGSDGSSLQLPFVQTLGGSLEGYFMKTISGKDIYAFEGIPYAEAPVGQRRFRPPVPKKPWKGVRSAQAPAPYCLQMHALFLDRIMGVEDCLKLNVYTPKLPSKSDAAKFPVILYIHGGSYQFGGAIEHGPAYLLERDVVLVTINYRVGILGFLSTGDKASPGNNGLKDQALAIQWVHENIQNFGGDPEKVTLMGQSAGAASVHLHLLSKRETRNYISRAISISATAFQFWAVQSQQIANKWTTLAARYARCSDRNTEKLMNCLRSRNPVRLVSNQFKMLDYFPNFPNIMFAPVVEPEGSDAFLTETPEEIYRKNGTLPVPYIVSNVEEEGEAIIVALPVLLLFSPFQKEWRKMAPIFLDYKNIKGLNKDEVTDAVEGFYFGNETDARNLPMPRFSRMITDRYFSTGIYKTLKLHSRIAPTYSSVFKYRGRFGTATFFGVGSDGKYQVGHTEDLFYIFNMTQFSQGLKLTDPEYKISQFMVDNIVSFAETGVPNVTHEGSVSWTPVDSNDVKQLVIDKNMGLEQYPKSSLDAIEFWNSLNLPDGTGSTKSEL